jgi:hypothetical protein
MIINGVDLKKITRKSLMVLKKATKEEISNLKKLLIEVNKENRRREL